MGSIGVAIPFVRTRPGGSAPEVLLADVWRRVGVQLDNLLWEDVLHREVLQADYIHLQADNRSAREGTLAFDFSDQAGDQALQVCPYLVRFSRCFL